MQIKLWLRHKIGFFIITEKSRLQHAGRRIERKHVVFHTRKNHFFHLFIAINLVRENGRKIASMQKRFSNIFSVDSYFSSLWKFAKLCRIKLVYCNYRECNIFVKSRSEVIAVRQGKVNNKLLSTGIIHGCHSESFYRASSRFGPQLPFQMLTSPHLGPKLAQLLIPRVTPGGPPSRWAALVPEWGVII